ncbi:MAG: AbrB/MazE/SpoVT family DNA-binding domain-containing protein [Planctomycetota bacterium]
MVRMLKKFGNTQALVIEKALREQLGIDENTPLEVTVDRGNLIVSPVNLGLGKQRVEELIDELRPTYTPMLKKLAE